MSMNRARPDRTTNGNALGKGCRHDVFRFGRMLRRIRVEAGLTLRRLGRKVRLSPAYLCRLENGKAPPPPVHRIEALASALQADPEELVRSARRLDPDLARYILSRDQLLSFLYEARRRKLDDPDFDELITFMYERWG